MKKETSTITTNNNEKPKLINPFAVEEHLEQAKKEYQDVIDAYGEELFLQQLELEDYSKRLGEHLFLQDLERRQGNSYENSAGERQNHRKTADLKTFPLTTKLIEHQIIPVYTAVYKLIEESLSPKRGVKPTYQILIAKKLYKGAYALNTSSETQAKEALANVISLCTMSVILEQVLSAGYTLENNLAHAIAREIESEAMAERLLNSLEGSMRKRIGKKLNKRVGLFFRKYFAKRTLDDLEIGWSKMTGEEALTLGLVLLDIVYQNTGYIKKEQPPYPTPTNKSMQYEIRPSDMLIDGWKRNLSHMQDVAHRLCPCLIPPKPWTNIHQGGVYYGTLADERLIPFMRHDYRTRTTSLYGTYQKSLEEADLSKVFEALNAIQNTPWKVNKTVLEILEWNIEHNAQLAGTPSTEPAPQLPPLDGEYTLEELREHKKKMLEIYEKEGERKGKALRMIGSAKAARAYARHERIYFPHNIDFRGRIYPIYQGLSPQGDDITKSLLLFADVPPIKTQTEAETAWYFFQIHGANLAGMDKKSMDKRLAYIKQEHSRIMQTTDHPYNMASYWGNMDEPFQFLAWTFEYAKCINYMNSHNGSLVGCTIDIPYAADGTCSGIQHFSAASRDEEGGRQVNLLPSDRPQDIYQTYADRLIPLLEKDAREGTPDEECVSEKTGETYLKPGTKTIAQAWLAYGITRKVVKRPVMTLPYGATAGGYREQILEDTLKPAIRDGKGEAFRNNTVQHASYLAKKLYSLVSDLNAVQYMEWLREVAGRIIDYGTEHEEPAVMQWTTPLGLPLCQAYVELSTVVARLRINGVIRKMYYTVASEQTPNKKKQVQGAPPNFIHSMDACHLQSVVLSAHEKGIRHFAMIHDSYGAPCNQADVMARCIREEFVRMYEEHDIFAELVESVKKTCSKGIELPEPPAKGTLNLKEILNSVYAFC
jgi:DNA-directed RNA polymerase